MDEGHHRRVAPLIDRSSIDFLLNLQIFITGFQEVTMMDPKSCHFCVQLKKDLQLEFPSLQSLPVVLLVNGRKRDT